MTVRVVLAKASHSSVPFFRHRLWRRGWQVEKRTTAHGHTRWSGPRDRGVLSDELHWLHEISEELVEERIQEQSAETTRRVDVPVPQILLQIVDNVLEQVTVLESPAVQVMERIQESTWGHQHVESTGT